MNPEQIKQDYQEALRRIRAAKETQATSLDLSGLLWIHIPLELFELTWLEHLELQQTNAPMEVMGYIPLLPEQFADLNKLRVLNIRQLGIKSLAPLGALAQLTKLNRSRNWLNDLAPLSVLKNSPVSTVNIMDSLS